MPTVIIGADLCPIGENRACFQAGDATSLFHDLLHEFEQADLVIANLECPLIERPSPIAKTGPTFGEPSDCINGIKAAGIDVLCLANNHILDHGSAGLKNTIEVCARAGIATVGAGENLRAAKGMLVRSIGDLRVGILAFAEHEFSIAGKDAWGANPLDLMEFVRIVQRERKSFDHLIVLLHGSAEFHVPTPRIQNSCRFMIEMGANTVIVQHPHCLGGIEDYEGGRIVYGQGALVMDEALYRNSRSFHEGFLVKLTLNADVRASMTIIPFAQSTDSPGARRLLGDREREFLEEIERKSRLLGEDGHVESQWLEFCDRQKHAYLSELWGHNRILRILNRHGLLTRWLYGRRSLLAARNLVCCETHREALETIFNKGML